MTTIKNEISSFYDDFSKHQQRGGCNERHILLYKKMLELGLSKKSNVLELGAGIGIVTGLIAQTVKTGKIITNDLSPKSIELSKKKNKQKNIDFLVSDISNLKVESIQFHFITLFDVLEHVPLDEHFEIFKKLSEIMDNETHLLINIPNPDFLEFIRETSPEQLQILDQAIKADVLLKNAYQNNLTLDFFITYSIWVKNDYQIICFKKPGKFKSIPLIKKKRFLF
jgi:trans-aconitate 2-methyltransferase